MPGTFLGPFHYCREEGLLGLAKRPVLSHTIGMKTFISAVLVSAVCAATARAGGFEDLFSGGVQGQPSQFQEPMAQPYQASYGGGAGGRQLALSQENIGGISVSCSQPDMNSVNSVMRSHDGTVGQISPRLVQLLCKISAHYGGAAIQVIYGGGFRSQGDSRLNSGMASGSLHLSGKAADIRIPGVSVAEVGRAARAAGAGGVGYYPNPPESFTHVDVGAARTWSGGSGQ